MIWRVATEQEIKEGKDHSNNKGMVLVEIIEVPVPIIEENL